MTECAGCGAPISYETGWCREGDLNSDVSHLYCLECRPAGRGYTIADLQAMKAENHVQRELARGARELLIIEAGGMDVLDALRSPR